MALTKKQKKNKKRRQAQLARAAYFALKQIPERFIDDGCSFSPDSMFSSEFGWACRIHDAKYCTRTGKPRRMTKAARKAADKELRDNISLSVPKWLSWVRLIYYKAVRRFGSQVGWDKCGYEAGEFCAHNMPRPLWMERITTLETTNEQTNEQSDEDQRDGPPSQRIGEKVKRRFTKWRDCRKSRKGR